MTSISKSDHERMQAALQGVETEAALKMKEELGLLHQQFTAHLEAARESVQQYDKQYKAARTLLAKAVKEHKRNAAKGVADGVIVMFLAAFLLQ